MNHSSGVRTISMSCADKKAGDLDGRAHSPGSLSRESLRAAASSLAQAYGFPTAEG